MRTKKKVEQLESRLNNTIIMLNDLLMAVVQTNKNLARSTELFIEMIKKGGRHDKE